MSLEAARDRICQLEDAVKRLDSVRKHLTRNSSEVCGEIRSSISRSIECLRNRELSLLGEVDQVQVMKEDALQLQQGRLNQAINILRTAITLVQDDSASEKHLSDTLERLNQLDLSPEETPYIAFRADQLQLRESLMNFGRVDANGLPLAMAFENPVKPSASLPRHLEEYEDVEHHVFNKTLHEINKESASSTSIRVCIPKLSQRLEDWLQQKPPVSGSRLEEDAKSRMHQEVLPGARALVSRPSTLSGSRPASSGALSQMADLSSCDSPRGPRSQVPSPGSSCSLNNWLSLIKNHADLEEEHDFEIVDNSRSKGNRGQSVCPELQKWLSPSSAPCGPASTDFFKHITKDSRVWLLQVCQQQLTSLEEMKQRDTFEHISKEPSSWLRSRAHSRLGYISDMPQTPSADFFSHISKDLSKWLAPQGPSECTEPVVHVSSEKIMSSSGHLSPAEEKWLLHGGGRRLQSPARVMSQPLLSSQSNFYQSQPSPMSPASSTIWLQSPNSQATGGNAQGTSCQDLFRHLAPSEDASWLLKSSSEPCQDQRDLMCAGSGAGMDDGGIWLRKKGVSQSSREVSPGVLTSMSDLSDWLLLPTGLRSQGSGSAEGSDECDKESSSDGWSICSTPHGVSTEQHAKDVAVAADYFNKWLL
ncbi:uncharacterized protein LOC101864551 isoform X2 [Aplysia californica]|uniref:Uncharacterized protein LOC101864551 isoform X2 n=1 Tax=Aplysia californica TaxID=6500 RepID=A0ABM0K3T4_APLCA|nr:uncharacterized protein LOC101864551 isoform X2 [Aplysia californica]